MSNATKVVITKSTMDKLAYTKFLYDTGLSNSTKAYPFSTIAILNYHDAIEFFLAIVMDVYGIKKSDKISECFNQLQKSGLVLSGKDDVEKIKKVRNNLKHSALIPSQIQLTEATIHTTNFFTKNTNLLLGMDFDHISTAQLIDDEEIKNHLIQALDMVNQSDNTGARIELAYAFWKTVDKYKDKFKNTYPKPYYFGNMGWTRSSFFMGLNERNNLQTGYESLNREFEAINNKFNKIGSFIDAAKESIEAMQDAVEMLSLGIDYRKYVVFAQLVPKPIRSIGGEYRVDISPRMNEAQLTEKDFKFCHDFIIECYFQLNG